MPALAALRCLAGGFSIAIRQGPGLSNIGLILRQLRAMNELAPSGHKILAHTRPITPRILAHTHPITPHFCLRVLYTMWVSNREHIARKVDHRQLDGEVSHYDDVSVS